jgi:hypothetical protein
MKKSPKSFGSRYCGRPVKRLLVSAVLLALAILSSKASADPFEDGASAFERGDYDTALQIWRPLADHDLRAAINLGVMYAEGLGVQKDAVEALRWLGPAALAGEPNAQMHLGVMFAEGIGGRPPNSESCGSLVPGSRRARASRCSSASRVRLFDRGRSSRGLCGGAHVGKPCGS